MPGEVSALLSPSRSDPRVPDAVLKGLAAGMFVEAAVAVWQRAHGVLQTPGTFYSQNLLGMISQFVIFPFFAVMLGGRSGRLAPAVVAAGLVIAILTASRGTIVLDFLGLATVFVLSALRQWTPRKTKVLWAGVAIAECRCAQTHRRPDTSSRPCQPALTEKQRRWSFPINYHRGQ